MLARLKAAIIILLVLGWPAPSLAQSGTPRCVQSGITASGDHTCAFTFPGNAMCWGDNSFGQLGNGTFDTPTPIPTVVVPSFAPTAIGPGRPGQLVAGQPHTCAILLPGLTPVCWGDDTFGQLGDGRSGTGVFSPTEVPVMDSNHQQISAAVAVAAGDQHSCALICPPNPPPDQPPCKVQCWGDNTFGQLGIGSTVGMSATPSNPVTFPPSTPPAIPANPPPVAISAGGLHTCAVMQDHTARCWGDNTLGQIGNCLTPRSRAPTPAIVNDGPCPTTAPLPDVVSIAAGEGHTCALFTGGLMACWGTGLDGELGSGDTTFSTAPVQVVDAAGQVFSGVQEIAAGSFHTCAIMKHTGIVKCWGINFAGQLGPAAGANSASPVTVPITDANGIALPVAHIAAGHNHTCATLAAGGVRCWGDNSVDQLGASTVPNTMSPVPVAVGGVCTCPGLTSCNGQCTDTSSDAQNCGDCGKACTGGTCVAGACQCPANRTLCPASGSPHVCADLTADSKNCGACGHACSTGETCSNGACVCSPGLTSCGGRCVNLERDNNNCGECGRHCKFHPPCNRVESGCYSCENGECEPF